MQDNNILYRYDGTDYTREQVDLAAIESGLSFDEYVGEYGLEIIDPTKKPKATATGATVEPKPKAPATASKPVVTSSASKSVETDPVKSAKKSIDTIISSPLSAEELDDIERRVNAEPSTRAVVPGGASIVGTGIGINANIAKAPIYPYSHQLNAAKKQLGAGAKQEDINNLAKNLYREELKTSVVKRKVDNVLNELEDQTNSWQSVGEFFESGLVSLSNLGLAASGSAAVPAKSTKEIRYESARGQVTAYAAAKLDERQKLVNKSIAGAKLTSSVVESNVKTLSRIEQEIKSTDDDIKRGDLVNQYNDVLSDTKSAAQAFEEYKTNIDRNLDYINYGSQILQSIPRSYNEVDVFENRVFNSALQTAANLVEFGQTGAAYMLKGVNPTAFSPELARELYTTPAEVFSDEVKRITEASAAQVREHRPLGDISSWSDFGEFMVDLASDQAVNTGLMFATGGVAGGVLLGASSAGAKMTEMWDRRAKGERINDMAFLGTALIYGGAEAGSEYVGFGQLKRSSKLLKEAIEQGAVTTSQLGRSMTDKLTAGLKDYGVNVGQEGFTEALAQIGQNIADITILGDQKSVFEGVNESFISGGLMSGLMFQAPAVLAGTVKLFNTPDEVKQAQINQKEINRLRRESIRLSIEIKNKQNEGVADEQLQSVYSNKKKIDDLIDDLALANTALMQSGIERINNLRDIEKSAVIKESRQIAAANAGISAATRMLNSDIDLDAATTTDLINQIKTLKEEKTKSANKINNLIRAAEYPDTLNKAYVALEQAAKESLTGTPTSIIEFGVGSEKPTVSSKAKATVNNIVGYFNSEAFDSYVIKNYGKEKLAEIKRLAISEIKSFGVNNGFSVFEKDKDNTRAAAMFLPFDSITLQDGTVFSMPKFLVMDTKDAVHHEVGHATLFNAIRESYGTDVISTMADSLMSELKNIFESDPEKYEYISSVINSRIKIYEAQREKIRERAKGNVDEQAINEFYDSVLAEEKLIAFLEYIKDAKFDYKNQSRLKNIYETVAKVLGKEKMKSYDVKNGKDVIEMLQSFNLHFDKASVGDMIRSIHENKLISSSEFKKERNAITNVSKIFDKILKSMTSLTDDIVPSSHPNSIQADKVNKLYEEKGVEAAYEIAELYGGMLRNILRKFKYLPNYENFVEDIVDSVKFGERGIFGLIKSFDPSRGVPLAAYINKYLSKRALGYITDYLNPEAGFMKDVTVQKDIVSEDDYDFEEDQPKRTHSVIRKFLGLTEQQMNKVRKAVINAVVFNPDIYAKRKWVPSEFKSELLKSFELDLFNLVKSDIFPSKNQDWYKYAEGMYEWLVEEVPMQVWLRSGVNIFYEPDIDPVNNKQKRMSPGEAMMLGVSDINSGRFKWIPRKPTLEEFMQYIKAEGINPNTGKEYSWTTVGTRKDTIAKILAREMAFDATLEVLKNPEQPTYDLDGNPDGGTIDVVYRMSLMSGKDYNRMSVLANVADIINRDPRVMFKLADDSGSIDNKSGARVLFEEAEEVFDRIKKKPKDPSDIAAVYSEIILDILDEKIKQAGIKPLSETKKTEIVESVLSIKFKDEDIDSEAWNKVRRAGMIKVAERLKEARKKKPLSTLESGAQTAREIADALRQEIGLSMSAREKELSDRFNKLLEQTFNVKQSKKYSDFDAQVAASNKSWLKNFDLMPVTAEDFLGLLYRTLAPGKLGEEQMAFYRKFLLYPFYDGATRHDQARVRILSGLKELINTKKNKHKQWKNTAFGNFTVEHVIRISIWNKTGESIPGISSEDIKSALELASKTPWISEMADDIIELMRPDSYGKPDPNWFLGSVENDIYNAINGHIRKARMKEFSTNADAIFNELNLNKMQAILGGSYKFALMDTLERMKSGKNRKSFQTTWERKMNDWINGSVGAIMFLNMRSAVLQMVSMFNYINWTDNNPINISKAFTNSKQMKADILTLWNSDFMVTRRDGRKIDVNEAELSEMLENASGNLSKITSWILQKGFTPTQVADSVAIIMGGAPFYRNRVNTYLKQGMTIEKAEAQAFLDFRETTEESQQSSRPDRISPQQASSAGRIILAFANTPGQYSRLMMKAAKDIKNGRGDLKTNISKIVYYSFLQNIIFNVLQQGLFRLLFDEDEENKIPDDEKVMLINGAADSILRGFGYQGAILSTLKNVGMEYAKQTKAGRYKSDKLIMAFASISPPISNKIRKINNITYQSSQALKQAKESGEYDFTSRPTLEVAAGGIELITNLPLTRALTKYDNVMSAMDEQHNVALRTAMLFGWPEWQLVPEEDDKKSYKTMTQDEFVESLNKENGSETKAMTEEEYIESLNKK